MSLPNRPFKFPILEKLSISSEMDLGYFSGLPFLRMLGEKAIKRKKKMTIGLKMDKVKYVYFCCFVKHMIRQDAMWQKLFKLR